ncbi:MAG TPA: hypothetical protein VGA17_03990 [Nitrospiraceae bacterium]|jgi:hypothetical protein
MLAGVLSGVMPGLGQFYCRQWAKGAAFLAAVSVADFSADVSQSLFDFVLTRALPADTTQFLVGSTIMLAIAGWSILDAVRTAKRAQ